LRKVSSEREELMDPWEGGGHLGRKWKKAAPRGRNAKNRGREGWTKRVLPRRAEGEGKLEGKKKRLRLTVLASQWCKGQEKREKNQGPLMKCETGKNQTKRE